MSGRGEEAEVVSPLVRAAAVLGMCAVTPIYVQSFAWPSGALHAYNSCEAGRCHACACMSSGSSS